MGIKILYAIQGTGNGHLARATEIIPILREFGETDILVSGIQGDLKLPFEVKYKRYGFSFIFGKKGGVDIWKTILKMKLFRLLNDICKLPVKDYDLVINDFEPVAAWACKLKRKNCIGLSHQNAVLHKKAVRPDKGNWLGEVILKHYAPAKTKYGFHFQAFDKQNFTPVVRSAIRKAVLKNKGHYTVYLPAFSDDEIKGILSNFPHITWEVFTKHNKKVYREGNIYFQPVSLEGFHTSFINSKGILCTAGFETPAEALFMGKKLLVIPMRNQYEQACNAAMLKDMRIEVIDDLRKSKLELAAWLQNEKVLKITYLDETHEIIQQIVKSSGVL